MEEFPGAAETAAPVDASEAQPRGSTGRAAGRREFAIRCLIAGALLLGGFLLVRLAELLLLVFAAILVAVMLRAVSDPLKARFGLSTGLSLTCTVTGFALMLAVTATAFGKEISSQMGTLIERLPEAQAVLLSSLREIGVSGEAIETLRNTLLGTIGTQLAGSFASGLAGVTVALAFALVGGIYFAAQPSIYCEGALRLIPPAYRDRSAATLAAIGRSLRLWLVGQLVVMAFIGTLAGVGAWLIGLPSALALGVMAGLLEFVPYVGPWLTIVPAVILGLTVSPEATLLMLAWLFVVQQVEGYVVTPLVQKEVVSLPPALSLFSLVAAGLLLGAPGVALAVPLTVAVFVAVKGLILPAIEGTGGQGRS